MEIKLNDFTKGNHKLLINQLERLNHLIKVNFNAEINVIDGMDKVIQWASHSSQNKHSNKRIIVIADEKIIFVLNEIVSQDSIELIDISLPIEEVVSESAKFLSRNVTCKSKEKKEQLTFSESEAETIFDFYTSNSTLTKKQQNTKYRILKRLNLNGCYQLFIWWKLTDILPQKTLKAEIKVKRGG